jgi:hypothetical protein
LTCFFTHIRILPALLSEPRVGSYSGPIAGLNSLGLPPRRLLAVAEAKMEINLGLIAKPKYAVVVL